MAIRFCNPREPLNIKYYKHGYVTLYIIMTAHMQMQNMAELANLEDTPALLKIPSVRNCTNVSTDTLYMTIHMVYTSAKPQLEVPIDGNR